MLSQVNGIDYAALSRASSVSAEAGIPDWAVYAKLNLSEQLSLDGFYQFAFTPMSIPVAVHFIPLAITYSRAAISSP
jgi:hypothetical protein